MNRLNSFKTIGRIGAPILAAYFFVGAGFWLGAGNGATGIGDGAVGLVFSFYAIVFFADHAALKEKHWYEAGLRDGQPEPKQPRKRAVKPTTAKLPKVGKKIEVEKPRSRARKIPVKVVE